MTQRMGYTFGCHRHRTTGVTQQFQEGRFSLGGSRTNSCAWTTAVDLGTLDAPALQAVRRISRVEFASTLLPSIYNITLPHFPGI